MLRHASSPEVRRLAPILCLLAVLVWPAPAIGQEPAGHPLMLWEATLPESNATVHLLGTIHEAPPDLYPLDSGYEEAFDKADTLVVEVNIAAVDMATVGNKVRKLSMLPDGVTLAEVIGPELWQLLTERLAGMQRPGLTPERVSSLQPLPVAFMLLTESLAKVQGQRGLGIEAYFLERALEKDLPVGELEGMLFQVELFASIPLEQQTSYLAMILDHGVEELGENFITMADAWKAGDLDTLAEYVRMERGSDPALGPFYDAILEGRNPHMAKKVLDYLHRGGDTLVLVGAAHLAGDTGILALLQNAGVRIRRLDSRGLDAPAPES
ncbi:TraB/GumN family protein [Oceanidesulfovibrio marinus]|uniref:TraB/GumN family protein n=1 Tax=Oceanidesulfovibrio marinus TaxID=370038 RepID=A0ABX6NF07_9BACT|nr:TraB/GumN family protein [Oceanidesulfovibrio marinus]QJT09157.1 TraB/GumN family protein [Oceanidesulfovibrio marinus]